MPSRHTFCEGMIKKKKVKLQRCRSFVLPFLRPLSLNSNEKIKLWKILWRFWIKYLRPEVLVVTGTLPATRSEQVVTTVQTCCYTRLGRRTDCIHSKLGFRSSPPRHALPTATLRLINVSAIQFSAGFMELWSCEIDLLAKFGNLRDLPCGLTVTRGGA